MADRLTLVFDADDTLWENNVLFERAFAAFCAWLAHPLHDETAVRAVLVEVETATVVSHGYGTRSFLRALQTVFERLGERRATAAEAAAIQGFGTAMLRGDLELVPGVAATLTELGGRHDLLLLTKGDPEEQQRKIDASTLAPHFRSTHIVPDKHTDTYLRLAAEQDLDPARTWMIGNSPRSDILPARAAGLNAVFIPNPYTWELELA
ncbi:MAG: HAD family hydrolase, partial [Pseudonocardia sp.]|nr:HAD family hydrolase [Pseudonocardia sp.]